MADLIDTANKITELVDEHGEIVDCKVKKCGTCRLIKELRRDIGEDESRSYSISKPQRRNKYIYVVHKDGKEIERDDSTYRVADLVGVSQCTIVRMIQSKRTKNGFTVTRELNELEEK